MIMAMSSIHPLRSKHRRAFSLVELLTVIAIIALLTAIIYPTVTKSMASARRAKASSNLRQICLAYLSYMQEGGKLKTLRTNNYGEWAAQLARYTGLNDAAVYFVDDDPAQEGFILPQTVLTNPNDASSVQTSGFASAPIAYAFASGTYTQSPPSTTPIVWTRGLQPDGTWSANSPYKGQGGFIGFLDGHVEWFNSLDNPENPSEGVLTAYGTNQCTKSILEAIGAQSGKPNPPNILEYTPPSA